MFRTTVYDNGCPGKVIEQFENENEVLALRDATYAVRALRQCGKPAAGQYTLRLEKVQEAV